MLLLVLVPMRMPGLALLPEENKSPQLSPPVPTVRRLLSHLPSLLPERVPLLELMLLPMLPLVQVQVLMPTLVPVPVPAQELGQMPR